MRPVLPVLAFALLAALPARADPTPEARKACDRPPIGLSDYLADQVTLAAKPALIHGSIACENLSNCTVAAEDHRLPFNGGDMTLDDRKAVMHGKATAVCVRGGMGVLVRSSAGPTGGS